MRTGFAVFVSIIATLSARAEIVPKTPEEMRKMSTHVVQGRVKAIYTSKGRAGNYERTHYVAELSIDKVEKGDGLRERELVYVRYWTQRWAGPGLPPPGTAGHRGLPAVGDQVRVYLVRNGYDGGGNTNDGGYNVVFADGFEPVVKAEQGK
jgi:hypothetical protein